MLNKIRGKLKTHLQQAGAGDLADTPVALNGNNAVYQSKENPAVVLKFEKGAAQLFYGNDDPNLPVTKIVYNDDGDPACVCLGNSGRGGELTYRPHDKIVGTILTAAVRHPSGRGFAVAELAKAAHATNQQGLDRWGVNLVTSAAHMDTKNPEAAHSAMDGVRRQWQGFTIPALKV